MKKAFLLASVIVIGLYGLLVFPRNAVSGSASDPQPIQTAPVAVPQINSKQLYQQGFNAGKAEASKSFSPAVSSRSYQPRLSIEGLPDNTASGVMPDGVVLRLTSGAINAMQKQLSNLLETKYIITYISSSLNGLNFAGNFCWAKSNWVCPF